MADILNLALPYFGLIFIGFACGKTRGLPEVGPRLDEFLPALCFAAGVAIRHHVRDAVLRTQQPAIPDRNHAGTVRAFVLAMVAGRVIGDLSLRKATMAGLAGAYGNIGYMGPGLALAVLGTKAAAPTALIFCCDSIFLFSIVPFLIALTDREHGSICMRSALQRGRSC